MLDLHMHSVLSDDGEFTPSELVRLAGRADVRVMALTDHNVVRGNREAQRCGESLGVEVVPGVEIDCTFEDLDLHVLGYFIDPEAPGWVDLEQWVLQQEQAGVKQKVANLAALGLPVDEAEARRRANQPIVSAEVLAELLLEDPALADHPRLQPYRPGGSRADMPLVHFYWDYFAKGKPAAIPLQFPSLSQAVAQIRRSGGVAVLAHPGHSLKGRLHLLPALRDAGLAGVEVFSSYHTEAQTADFLAAARELGMVATPGSDFHGRNKPGIRLGATGCTLDEAAIWKALQSVAGRG